MLDIIALGNLVQMRYLLNRRYYKGEMSREELKEDVTAQLHYQVLMRKLSRYMSIRINEQPVPVMGLVDRSFIIFVAGIVRMKRKVHADVPKVAGCSYRRFRSEVDTYINREYPDLEDRYHQLLKVDLSFMWTHPDIDIEVFEEHKGTTGSISPGGLDYLEEVMFGSLVDSQSDEENLEKSSEEEESSEESSEAGSEAGSEQEDGIVKLRDFLRPRQLDERDKKTKDEEDREPDWCGDVRPTKRPRHA